MSDEARTTFNLPRIRRLVLRHFSLYSAVPVVDVNFDTNVFCLAGANGLGKSTFLAILNYLLTGIVADKDRTFTSVDEYYRHSLPFSETFFTGRVDESDRELAEGMIELVLGDRIYALTRGIFEPDELRAFRVLDAKNPKKVLVDTADMTPNARHEIYTHEIVADTGLASFEQYVFLQHFVFTFDERRHLLFWDKRVLEPTLYLAFGATQQDAENADRLRREEDRAASRARNYAWQATEVRRKLEELEKIQSGPNSKDDPSADLVEKHKQLISERDGLQQDLQKTNSNISDLSLKLSELSSRQAALRSRYEAEFSARFEAPQVSQNPFVALSIAEDTCQLCGGRGSSARIQKKLAKPVCPLCDLNIAPSAKKTNIDVLRDLDTQLSKVRRELDEAARYLERLHKQRDTIQSKLAKTSSRLSQIESDNSSFLTSLSISQSKSEVLDTTVTRYRAQYDELNSKKQEFYSKRDGIREDLKKLRKRLLRFYTEAEDTFVPYFKRLATDFLGIDLDIRLEEHPPIGLNLALEVKSTARRELHQLSESQRFFLDIALRMALTKQLSPNGGTILIDTPEGSLDIAYESRAGSMFASFAESGGHLVMVSNINTSQLLITLAQRCGNKGMTVCRMTSWTELSDVQAKEEALFERAYAGIESALTGKLA